MLLCRRPKLRVLLGYLSSKSLYPRNLMKRNPSSSCRRCLDIKRSHSDMMIWYWKAQELLEGPSNKKQALFSNSSANSAYSSMDGLPLFISFSIAAERYPWCHHEAWNLRRARWDSSDRCPCSRGGSCNVRTHYGAMWAFLRHFHFGWWECSETYCICVYIYIYLYTYTIWYITLHEIYTQAILDKLCFNSRLKPSTGQQMIWWETIKPLKDFHRHTLHSDSNVSLGFTGFLGWSGWQQGWCLQGGWYQGGGSLPKAQKFG